MLAEALDVEFAERSSVLDVACAGNDAIRREVEALLQADASTPNFLDAGALALAAPALTDLAVESGEPKSGEVLGSYRIQSEIGSGGMSRVYLAEREDGVFSQEVAIKVMSADFRNRPELADRFRVERQILATFDHPDIARVFDGGVTLGGLPYLVMEHVNGVPLTTHCERHSLTLEDRLALIVRVCGAVQYAHQHLVVHRDLKPSNILVSDEGRVKLLDFGIAKLLDPVSARHPAASPATRTGQLLLTPEYAAPEQIQGQEVTTATDVYALGIVLYELLIGSRPYSLVAKTPSQVEEIVCRRESPLPSGLPADLGAVVLRCLEKEPRARYDSARELAEDLRRFLDGESVRARPVSWTYRLFRRARRNKARVALAAIVVCALALLAGLSWNTKQTADARAQLAAQLGQRVERIQGILQRAYALPLHDIRTEKTLVRAEMERIEEEMPRLGSLGEGPGQYALGRAHLALGELESARELLESAWNGGYREPGIATSLGLTLGQLYERALDTARRTRNERQRNEQIATAEGELRDPALRFLRTTSHETLLTSRQLAEAFIAFYENDLERAEKTAREAHQAAPWLWEAHKLEGDAQLERALEAFHKGEYDAAELSYRRGGEAYSSALAIARSSPKMRLAECRRRSLFFRLEQARGGPTEPAFESTVEACDLALAVDPEDWEIHYWVGQVYHLWGTEVEFSGGDGFPPFERSIAAATEAIRLRPDAYLAHTQLGGTLASKASTQVWLGHDPTESLDRASEALLRAAEINPAHANPWTNLGIVYATQAEYRKQHGEDPIPAYDRAVGAFREATSIDPRWVSAWSSLCAVQGEVANFVGDANIDRDPFAILDTAMEACDRCLELNPSFYWAQSSRATVLLTRGLLQRSQGEDPRPTLDQAVEGFEKAAALNPGWENPRGLLGDTYLEIASYLLQRGGDPRDELNRAQVAYAEALNINPEVAEVLLGSSSAHRLLAEYFMSRGEDPSEELAASEALARRALSFHPGEYPSLTTLAKTRLLAADWRMSQENRNPEPVLAEVENDLGQAIAVNPRFLDSWRVWAELETLRAEWRQGAGTSVDTPIDRAIESGLAKARNGLEINPRSWDLLAREGALLLLRAKSTSDSELRCATLQDSERSLATALEHNSLLDLEFGDLLIEVPRLRASSTDCI